MQNRLHYIDTIKGVGIILVIIGHMSHDILVTSFIYGFHMPLFFFISGYLFNLKEKSSFTEFAKYKFNTLIIPYIIFYSTTLIYYYLIEQHFRSEYTRDVTWYEHILGLFYGTNYKGLLNHNTPLWFLPALYITELLYYYIHKLISKVFGKFLLSIIFLLIGVFLFNVGINWLPFSMNVSFIALFYFTLGSLLYDYDLSKIKEYWKSLFIGLGALAIYCALFYYIGNGKADLVKGEFGENIFLYYVMSVFGILGVWFTLKYLPKLALLELIGMSSLVILSFHGIFMRVILKIYTAITHQDVDSIRTNLFVILILSFLTAICILPLNKLTNKYIFKKNR